MLAHAGFTKKQIVYNIDSPFNAAQEEYKERKKKRSPMANLVLDCDKKKMRTKPTFPAPFAK
jgi:hypothetical protein